MDMYSVIEIKQTGGDFYKKVLCESVEERTDGRASFVDEDEMRNENDFIPCVFSAAAARFVLWLVSSRRAAQVADGGICAVYLLEKVGDRIGVMTESERRERLNRAFQKLEKKEVK